MKIEITDEFRPSKIVCVGRNYAAHAKELGNEVPAEPLYASAFSALFGVDKPHNLMPSLHVVFSCLILFMCRDGANVVLRVLLFVWVVLIVASTVLVHQHHLIDALTGLAVVMLLRRYIRP